jgi:hypothetical protein
VGVFFARGQKVDVAIVDGAREWVGGGDERKRHQQRDAFRTFGRGVTRAVRVSFREASAARF